MTHYDHRTGQDPQHHRLAGALRLGRRRRGAEVPLQLDLPDPVLATSAARALRLPATSSSARPTSARSWEVISPDLTRNDPDKLNPPAGRSRATTPAPRSTARSSRWPSRRTARASSGPAPTTGWSTSPRTAGRPGRTSRPAATSPEWALISIVEPSPHDADVAYVAATRYKLDDTRPYLYKTTDDGATWTKITGGIPDDEFTRVIREDPNRRGLLYAGTETGIYVSFDDGANWQRLGGQALRRASRSSDLRPRDQGRRAGRRHPRPLVLDPGRPDAAPPGPRHAAAPGQRWTAAPPLPAAADRASPDHRRLRRGGGAGDRRPRAGLAGMVSYGAHRRQHHPRAAAQAAGRRVRHALPRRRAESAERRR